MVTLSVRWRYTTDRLAGGRAPAQVQAALDQPDQELQLGPRSDVRLRVAQHVCCSDAELTSRQVNILVDEHVFPRHEDIVEYDQRIGLVEAAGQRVVEHAGGSERIRPPRVELQAGRAGRHYAGDRVIFVARPQGQDDRDQHVIGHDRTGAEHLCPAHDDAAVALGSDAGVEIRLGLLVRRLGAVNSGMDDDVAEVQVLVSGLGGEAQQVVGERLPTTCEERGRAREARDERRHMIRRAAQEAVAGISPAFDRAPPRRQILAGARHQPAFVDGPAVAWRGVGHQLAVRRIVGQVVELRDRTHPGSEGGVRRHIGAALAVQQYRAAITQATHVFVATPSHITPFLMPLPEPRHHPVLHGRTLYASCIRISNDILLPLPRGQRGAYHLFPSSPQPNILLVYCTYVQYSG